MFAKIDYGEFNEQMRAYISLPDKERKQAYLTLLKENKELKSSPMAVKSTNNNINDDYKIEACDELNVTLLRRRIVQNGKNKGDEVWDTVAYVPNVKIALQTLVTREINGTGLNDFKEVVAKVDELMKQIEKFKISHDDIEIAESDGGEYE